MDKHDLRMRSESLDLKHYDTDKGQSGYLRHYDRMFASLVDQPIKLLEIGVRKGGSLALWRDYFPRAAIAGIDLDSPGPLIDGIQFFKGSQADTKFLTDVATKVAPDGFDVIIDDASHLAMLTKTTFWHLFDHHLKPGGHYVIEDWGTGYWSDWPDGRAATLLQHWRLWERLEALLWKRRVRFPSHDYGMVGLVKELVDEVGITDLLRAKQTEKPTQNSRFESMTIVPGMVFIQKVNTARSRA